MTDTLPTVLSPPLAPAAPLSETQLRFLRLHIEHLVEQWTWHFSESMLCARSERRRAYIWRDELNPLLAAGLMEPGHGYADVRVTEAGRLALLEREKERTSG